MTINTLNPKDDAIDTNQQHHIELNAQSPWPGLAAYDESASHYFFGRSEEAKELLRMALFTPLTVLYGKSGLGKTSLLQAGFYPLLRTEHYFPVHLRLDYSSSAAISPLDQTARKLQAALTVAQADFTAWNKNESLWQYLHRRDLEIWSHDNYLLTPVLIFDQFEEIFSRANGDADHIQSNLNSIADLIENRIPSELTDHHSSRHMLSQLDLMSQNYRIVLAFREDFLPEIEGWKEQVPSLLRNRLRLLPMNRERAIDAVSNAGSAVLAPGVAEPLVNFVGNLDSISSDVASVIEPVLLSLCCYQLNQRRSQDGKIDAELLQHAGQDILQDFYDEALSDMPTKVSQFIETYLIQGSQYRGSYPVEQAIQDGFITRQQLSTLADKYRLLRIDQQLGANRIELIHDRLVGVVSKARDERLRQIENQSRQAKEQEHQRQLAFKKAELDATNLRRQARKLHAALFLSFCLAGVAGYGWYTTDQKQQEVNSLRAVLESLDMANGTRSGGDERAIMQLLAINQTAPSNAVDEALLTVLLNKNATKKIWSTGDRIVSTAFNQNGTRIASVSEGNLLQVWDANSGQLIHQKANAHECNVNEMASNSTDCAILSVSISPDGATIVSGGQDKTLRLWDMETLEPIGELLGHGDDVTSVAFNNDGTRLVSGSYDHTLRLWDVDKLKPIGKPLPGHKEGVTNVAFSPDGAHIASASHDNTIRIWDTDTAQLIGSLAGHKDSVTSVAYSTDGLNIVSGSQDRTLRLWDTKSGKPIGKPFLGHDDTVWDVAFSPDNTTIVSGSDDRTLRLWETKTGQAIGLPLQGHEESVRSVSFSPDGKYIVSGGRDTTLRLWDTVNNQPINAQLKGGHKDFVASVAYSLDGKYIVSGGDDATIRLWDAGSGKPIGKPMQGHTGSLNGVAFSPDGKFIVSGSSDKTLRLWDTASQTLVVKMTGHQDYVESVAFSPNGKYIASGSNDNNVQLWDGESGEAIGKPMSAHTEMVRGVAFNADSSLVASASYDGTVRLWNVDTRQSIAELTGHEAAVTSVAFSLDGNHLVSGSKDNTLIRWDLKNHQAIGKPLSGHTDRVNSVAFSPDGKHIISGSSDKTLRLWDRASGQAIGKPMRGHEQRINSVVFNASGTRIVSGSDDMTLRIWPATNNWAEQLCNKLTHNMSYEEWENWVSSDIKYKKQCLDLPIPPSENTNNTN